MFAFWKPEILYTCVIVTIFISSCVIMGTATWGRHLWYSIHYIALGYPASPSKATAEAYKSFFTSLHHVIPCKKCASHYMDHLQELPIDGYLTDTSSLFEWTVLLHNIVNRQLGKPEMSVANAYSYYMNNLQNTQSPEKQDDYIGGWWLFTGSIGIVILLVILIVWSRKH